MDTSFNYTNQLYFTVLEQDDPRFLLLFDHSVYMDNLPSTPVYDIIPPGFDTAIRINAVARGITAINSALLYPYNTAQMPDLAPLTDGIYILTYRVQPYDTFYTTQNTMNTRMLERSLDEVYIKVEHNNNHAWYKQWKSDLLNIGLMITTAKALTRLNALSDASEVYNEARTEASRLIRMSQKLTV
jgi:hypothetical protein